MLTLFRKNEKNLTGFENKNVRHFILIISGFKSDTSKRENPILRYFFHEKNAS